MNYQRAIKPFTSEMEQFSMDIYFFTLIITLL